MDNIPEGNINIYGKEITDGISLITAVKNREEMLRQALPTWLANPEIDEIIIVDWSSDQSLEPLVKEFQDGRIILAIVKDQPRWVLTYAYNLAARIASRDKLLKTDADVKLLPGFFSKHKLKPGLFFTGNWVIARNENEKHLNGTAFYFRNDFFKINGFNEFITTYGWDDSDLVERMIKSGLERIDILPDYLYHIPHEQRVLYQAGTHFLKNIDDQERALVNIIINNYIARNYKTWDQHCNMSEFHTVVKNEFMSVGFHHLNPENQIPEDLLEKSELYAIKERLRHLNLTIPSKWSDRLNKQDLIALYRLYLLSRSDPTIEPDAKSLLIKILQQESKNMSLSDHELKMIAEKNSILAMDLVQKQEDLDQLKIELQKLQDKLNLLQNSKTYRYGSVLARIISKIFFLSASKK